MASLVETLGKQLLSSDTLETLTKKTNADSSQITNVIAMGLPLLLNAMKNNSKNEEGAKSLAKALDDHADEKTTVKDADENDGKKIINHILGDNAKDATKNIANKTNLSVKQVMSILSICAPILMSLLGKEKKSSKTNDSDLTSLFSGLLGNSSKKDNGLDLAEIAGTLLKDTDNDGKSDILDTIGSLSKLFKS